MTTSLSNLTREEESELVQKHIGLVRNLARKFNPGKNDYDDYVQAGMIGLMKSIRKFNPDKAKLTTYAYNSIRWEIIRHINKTKRQTDEPSINSPSPVYSTEVDIEESFSDELTSEQKEIVKMRIEKYSFQEIADKLGTTKQAAAKTYKQVIKRLGVSEKLLLK